MCWFLRHLFEEVVPRNLDIGLKLQKVLLLHHFNVVVKVKLALTSSYTVYDAS